MGFQAAQMNRRGRDRSAPGRWGAAAGGGGPRGRDRAAGSSQYQHFPKQNMIRFRDEAQSNQPTGGGGGGQI